MRVNDTTGYWRYAALWGATWIENLVGSMDMTTKAIKHTPQWRIATDFWHHAWPAEPNAKEAILATAAHELRTPLTSIRALSAILHDNPQLDLTQRQKYLQIILQESEKLAGLVEDMLRLAELEIGHVTWQVTDVDLGQVIEEAVSAVSHLVTSENIRLQVRLPETVPLISADHRRLVQVVMALLSNAIKCCDKESGWVGLRLQQKGIFLQVEVSDNGPDIATGYRPVVLEKSYPALAEAAVKEPKITSLGLLMSHDIVSHFGGKLWTAPPQKHGAKFCFTLPIKLANTLIDPWQSTRSYLLTLAKQNEELYSH
ncbi:MAG: HAMP domain-containing histidine kinase [Anaerolineae bacterium]|nr:HAMP domain-containing histidine kinase [Anaerolineae bacterium]